MVLSSERLKKLEKLKNGCIAHNGKIIELNDWRMLCKIGDIEFHFNIIEETGTPFREIELDSVKKEVDVNKLGKRDIEELFSTEQSILKFEKTKPPTAIIEDVDRNMVEVKILRGWISLSKNELFKTNNENAVKFYEFVKNIKVKLPWSED